MAVSPPPIQFKQGTSFGASCVYTQDEGGPVDLTGVVITSAIRDAGYNYYPLIVTITSPTTFTVIFPTSTMNWVVGPAYWDIMFTYGAGSTFLTQSIQFFILPSVTGSFLSGSIYN